MGREGNGKGKGIAWSTVSEVVEGKGKGVRLNLSFFEIIMSCYIL